jgi:uncharacterized protein YndB with AHSA1/START domain
MELFLITIPDAREGMLIRKPAEEVYDAFANPAATTKFWFSKSSGRLEVGKLIRWDWEMYGVSMMVDVKKLEPVKRILMEWDEDKNPTRVEITFTARMPDTTFVSIAHSGFSGNSDRIVEQAMGSAARFGLALAGLKAYLEYWFRLHLVEDRFPDQLINRSMAMR